jgi:hypothetical protein
MFDHARIRQCSPKIRRGIELISASRRRARLAQRLTEERPLEFDNRVLAIDPPVAGASGVAWSGARKPVRHLALWLPSLPPPPRPMASPWVRPAVVRYRYTSRSSPTRATPAPAPLPTMRRRASDASIAGRRARLRRVARLDWPETGQNWLITLMPTFSNLDIFSIMSNAFSSGMVSVMSLRGASRPRSTILSRAG